MTPRNTSCNIPDKAFNHCKLPFAKQYNLQGRDPKKQALNKPDEDIRFCAPCYAAAAGRAIAAETAAAGSKAKSYGLSAGYKKNSSNSALKSL